MITREDIRELPQFQGNDADSAISFYFQPSKPTNKLHREDAILHHQSQHRQRIGRRQQLQRLRRHALAGQARQQMREIAAGGARRRVRLTAAEMHAYYIAIVTAPKLVFHRPDVR